MKFPSLVVIAVALVSAATMMAQPAWPVFDTPSAFGRHVPALTTSPTGAIVLTFAERHGQTARYFTAVSDDGGRTFSEPLFVAEAPFGAAILQRQPYAVMDGAGTLHILLDQPSGPGERALFHRASTDRGRTWSDPVRISTAPPSRPQDFGSITVGADGTIYATYISVLPEPDGYTHIFLVRSTDGGRTWSDERRVDSFATGGCCECCIQRVIITSRGEVVVAFRSNIMNRRDVHVTRSNDGGRTFAPAVLIQAEPWYIEGCPGTGPSIVCDSTNTLHITWRDARDPASPGSLFYAQLPDGSTQTPPNMLINPPLGTDGEYPVVATDRTGASVGIVWFANDGVWQLLRNGAEMGRAALSSSALQNPGVHIVWNGTGFLAIWQDMIDGTADLRMLRTDLETSVQDDHDADTSTPWMYVDLLGRIFTRPPYAGWWMRVRPRMSSRDQRTSP